jgi:hypothetical protein
MNFFDPLSGFQVTFGSMEVLVSLENPARWIDAFTDQLDLKRLGFCEF